MRDQQTRGPRHRADGAKPRLFRLCAVYVALLASSQAATAHDLAQSGTASAAPALSTAPQYAHFNMASPTPMGTAKLQPDPFTKLTGWELRKGWYFGKRTGDHSGVAFIWQIADDQLSVSTRGIRFVRRF